MAKANVASDNDTNHDDPLASSSACDREGGGQSDEEEQQLSLIDSSDQGDIQSSTSTASSDREAATTTTCVHFFGAVANLCSATLGAGVLSLPFALYQSGVICGLLLLLCSGWATAISIDRLALASDRYNRTTYEQVVQHVLGKRFRQAIEISILLFCVGCMVAYVIAVGDVLEQVNAVIATRKRLAMTLVWTMAMLPLSCLRRMQSLQFASTVGMIGIGTLLVAAAAHLILGDGEYDHDYYADTTDTNNSLHHNMLSWKEFEPLLWPANYNFLSVLRACPIFFFAYSCQVNVCQIYDELPPPRQHNNSNGQATNNNKLRAMSRVTWVAIGGCTLLYTCISLVTLLDFGSKVKANILSCYSLTIDSQVSGLLHAAFMAMAVAIVMAFPLNVFPARVSLIQMVASNRMESSSPRSLLSLESNQGDCTQPLLSNSPTARSGDTEQGGASNNDQLVAENKKPTMYGINEENDDQINMNDNDDGEESFSACQHMIATLAVAGTALGLALVVPNISVVFGLLGGTTSSLLGFVVPGLLGIHMNPSDVQSHVLVWAGSGVGIITTLVTLYTTIIESV